MDDSLLSNWVLEMTCNNTACNESDREVMLSSIIDVLSVYKHANTDAFWDIE